MQVDEISNRALSHSVVDIPARTSRYQSQRDGMAVRL